MLHHVYNTTQIFYFSYIRHIFCLFYCLGQEQHILDDFARPQTWAGTHRQHHYESLASPSHPVYIYQAPPPAPPPAPRQAPQPPRIIQHTVRE